MEAADASEIRKAAGFLKANPEVGRGKSLNEGKWSSVVVMCQKKLKYWSLQHHISILL